MNYAKTFYISADYEFITEILNPYVMWLVISVYKGDDYLYRTIEGIVLKYSSIASFFGKRMVFHTSSIFILIEGIYMDSASNEYRQSTSRYA